jgi:hypothetical protein
MVSQVQQMRSLLECVWPAALDAARQPFRSRTWTAAMTVICERDGGDLARTRRLGEARFEQLVRREITRRGGRKPSLRIVRQLFTALADSTGVTAHRPGALERVGFLLQDWQTAADKLTDTETRMTGVLHELKLTELATSIPGLSAVGAAAILAETGDPNRFTTARALVKHAGLAPRENLSGNFVGRAKLTGQGRPGLRLTAWRAVWGAQRANPVYAARYQHLTTRETNKLTATQAQTVIAAAILRQLHAVTTTGQPWDPQIAPRHRSLSSANASRRLDHRRSSRRSRCRSGRALRGIEEPRLPRRSSWAAPPVVSSTRLHAAGINPSPLRRDRRRTRHRPRA